MAPSSLLANRGIVRDQIHGFIEINNLEYMLMQNPFLRRLHGIKQLGKAYLVFPGATHTRFNHSLGAMHVSGLIAARVAPLARKGSYCGRFFLHCDQGTENFIAVARLSGLLHDIGHMPLSHQVEISLKSIALKKEMAGGNKAINQALVETVAKYGRGFHEAFTKHYIHRIVEWLEDNNNNGEAANLVRAAGAVLDAFSPDALEYVGLSPEAYSVLHDIISNDVFDADRLDYLLRDAAMSGVVFGSIDIERLLIGIELHDVDGKLRIGVHPKSLQTLEDVFDSRFKMFKTVYYHHKSIATNVAITRVVELLIDNWDDVAPPQFLKGLSGPEDLYKPEKMADLILSGATLYTDSDFDFILYNMVTAGGTLRRWAQSLLHRRELLPISLVKRPEALALRALERLGVRGRDQVELAYKVQIDLANLVWEKGKILLRELEDNVYKAMKSAGVDIDRDSLHVEFYNEPIIRGDFSRISMIYKSLYLNMIYKLGKVRPLFAFVFSDDEKDHLAMYRMRAKLRSVYEDFLTEKVKSIIKK